LTIDSALKIADVAKQSIDHKALELDDIQIFKSMVKIPDRAVLNYEEFNPRTEDAVNPNSAIMSYFQYSEYTYEKSAIVTILFTLLNEPCFE
jgi:hypothetical protein